VTDSIDRPSPQSTNTNAMWFAAHGGWREAEWRSRWSEAFRLKRTPRFAWLWNLLGKLQPKEKVEAGKRMSGIMLLTSEH
jgi:hypothetical protein